MEDTPAKQTPGEELNKLDLSALKSFEFGTQWTPATDPKKIKSERSDRPRGRDRGRSGAPGGKGGAQRRDRRPARPERRDAGGPAGREPDGRSGGAGERGRGERRGRDRRREPGGRGKPAMPPRPYVSPWFEVTFYPDDVVFGALVKAMRASCRTYELFEIARLILEKPERCVVVIKARPGPNGEPGSFYVSVPDGVPFPTEEEAVSHVLEKHIDKFFTTETVEVDPPKGVFNFVTRCPITGKILGAPNYHRYPQILREHYATHSIRMDFERYRNAVEVVKDPDAVAQWLESMKTVTRYTFLEEVDGEKKSFDSLEDARVFLLHHCRDRVVRVADSTRVPAKNVVDAENSEARRAIRGVVEAQRRFPLDTANALRGRLRRENFHLYKRGSKGVTYVCAVRRKFRQPGQVFAGSVGRMLEILDAHPMIQVSALAEKLLGFAPPPPAAAPRKPEAKGVDAAAQPGVAEEQPASVEAAEDTSAEEPAASAPADDQTAAAGGATEGEAPAATSAPLETPAEADKADAEASAPSAGTDSAGPAESAEKPDTAVEKQAGTGADALTPEQKEQLKRFALDLRWLVTEGYVAEFSDGRLFAHPVMEPEGPGRKKSGAAEAPGAGKSPVDSAQEAAGAESAAAAESEAGKAAAESSAGTTPPDAAETTAAGTPSAETGEASAGAAPSEETAGLSPAATEPQTAEPAEEAAGAASVPPQAAEGETPASGEETGSSQTPAAGDEQAAPAADAPAEAQEVSPAGPDEASSRRDEGEEKPASEA